MEAELGNMMNGEINLVIDVVWPLNGSWVVYKFREFFLIRLSVNVWEGWIQTMKSKW